jgi:phenylacetyl-CoA:acceptor oxidoreductase 26-kDa subunit
MAGGAGSGLLIVGALAGLPRWPTGLLGVALIGFGLACVWAEIGKPWRALNVFFHPRTSWMTREAVAALLVYVFCAAALLFGWTVLLGATALAALGFVYCQARILTASRGIPAWREPLVVPLIVATGLTEGAGLAVLISVGVARTVPETVAWSLLGLLALRWLNWRLYAARLQAGAAPAGTLTVVRRLDRPLSLVFHVLPALLILAGLALPEGGTAAILAAAFLSVAGGGWFKYTLVTRMAFTQGFALPVSPVRGGGLGGPGTRPGWE